VKRVHKTEEVTQLLKSKGPCMVVIYADWCGHCQDAAPAWKKLSNSVDGKATVYAIESAEYSGEVNGYPTVKIVKDGHSADYGGERTVPDMEKALLGKGLLGGKRTRRRGTRRLRNGRRKTHRALR
jgi:thiol-disulfide isomerase/thioredoxin